MTLKEQQRLEDAYVMHTFGRKPVELVSGQGMVVTDVDGRSYLDFISGIGVISLGHCHPALVGAIREQAARLMHVSNYYYIEHRGELAEQLSTLLNSSLLEGEREPWQTFFANSGAEANECAIKLARIHASKRAVADGRAVARTVVTLEGSFHGRTLATLAATAQPAKQEAFQPLPDGFVATPVNDVAALERLFVERGVDVCAVLLECIQGESGVHPCSAEFLAAARRLTSQYGALLVFDEVQCGIYRCGTHPFAFQHFGIAPDAVTMAKGLGGGFPLGACSARACVAASFAPGDHGSTFGGSSLAVRAARTVLETIEREGIADNVTRTGAYLRSRLGEVSGVCEVRGRGLMVGADLDDGLDAFDIALRALDAGLLINATGPRTLRFLPPLICTNDDVDALIGRLTTLL